MPKWLFKGLDSQREHLSEEVKSVCVSDFVAIKVINTVNQGIERKFVNGGRLSVTEPAGEE